MHLIYMKKFALTILGTLLLACNTNAKDFEAGAAIEQKAETPVEAYMNISSFSIYLCRLTFKLRQQQAKSQRNDFTEEDLEKSDYQSCISQYVAALTTAHSKAQASIKKTAKKAALKEHFILSLATLKGISPLDSERVIDYDRRNNASTSALEQQKIRFEAE